MKIGCSVGTITNVSHSDSRFTILIQNDEGVFDTLSYQEDDQQLKDIATLLETTFFPTHWVGTRVKLIFGPKLFSISEQSMLYGIGNILGNTFIIPEYLFEIVSQKMEKSCYTFAEVVEFAEIIENSL